MIGQQIVLIVLMSFVYVILFAKERHPGALFIGWLATAVLFIVLLLGTKAVWLLIKTPW